MWFRIVLLTITVARIVSTNICRSYYQTTTNYISQCGLYNWGRCARQRTVTRYNSICCTGYSNFPICNPVCNGRTLSNNACDETYSSDMIRYRDGTSYNSGGGTCTSPNTCTGCRDGFYSSGGRCLICPPIANCNHRRCTGPHDNHCEWCRFEIMPKQYWRGYTRNYDGQKKTCKKACSWRSDSTRCYPGDCKSEIVESCTCTSGFTGSQCDKLTEETSILYALMVLRNTYDLVEVPRDGNIPDDQSTSYTNKEDFNSVKLQFVGKFQSSGLPPPLYNSDHFVKEFRCGIIYGQLKLHIIRSSQENVFIYNCTATEDAPTIGHHCSTILTNNSDFTIYKFRHSERLVYEIDVRNGGYLKYINRETNVIHRVSLIGKRTRRNYTVQWDYEKPYYSCFRNHGAQCTQPLFLIQDVTDKNFISFSWQTWTDDLAGIDYYQYDVFEFSSNGTSLQEKRLHMTNMTQPSVTVGSLYLTSPGMYSLILTAFDKAGNYKSSRSLVFFDDNSVVEKVPGTRIIVTNASVESNYTWIVTNTSKLHITWLGRFINQRHYHNRLLEPVASRRDVDKLYDDIYGRRTVDEITNVKGIVKFEVKYTISGPDVSSIQDYIDVQHIDSETATFLVSWYNGQKMEIIVKATDIIGKFKEDTVTVYKDTTAPLIQNLWLIDGNETANYFLRSIDFTAMEFEWDSYDFQSGLHNIEWKLFDNNTATENVYGSSVINTEGNIQNITQCEAKYRLTPRGPACYCTPYHGCFKKHFYVRPEISMGSGLAPGKDKGVQGSIYYIEILATNMAMTKSVSSIKITVDITAPLSGYVHDGVKGTSEIDYQQELQLNAYWDGFFDPESGVSYYIYMFADHCVNRSDLIKNNKGIKTYFENVNYTTKYEGKYFITVVAINKANLISPAECSDGVLITTTLPTVKDFVLKDAKTYPQLVRDANSSLWLIDETVKRISQNNTYNCSYATVADVKLFPKNERNNTDCSDLSQFNNRLLFVLTRTSKLEMAWKADVGKDIIKDYEIGLSSKNKSFPPDILTFHSTEQSEHICVNSSNITGGEIFYILIKTISASNVEGIQSYGPVVIDETPPNITDTTIIAQFVNGTLIAYWSENIFEDNEDPYPLVYEYTVGYEIGREGIVDNLPFSYNDVCIKTIPPKCTVIDFIQWTWHSRYYITTKATNLAGLTSSHISEVYTHEVPPPTAGEVNDIMPAANESDQLKNIMDIDYSVFTDRLSVQWKYFYHPYLSIEYTVCAGSSKGLCDVGTEVKVYGNNFDYTFYDLMLSTSQKYYITVKAVTTGGFTKVSSDGITILDNSSEIVNFTVNDVKDCSAQVAFLNDSQQYEVYQDPLPECKVDIDYQSSIMSIVSSWNYPDKYRQIIGNSFLKLDRKSTIDDRWDAFTDYFDVTNYTSVMVTDLKFQPGIQYRSTVKLCAIDTCFPPSHSDGVVVTPNKPVTGSLDVNFKDFMIVVEFYTMHDPDIKDKAESIRVVSRYEWLIMDSISDNDTNENWRQADNLQKINNTHTTFEVSTCDKLDLLKCQLFKLRGYNKADVYAEVIWKSSQCSAGNQLLQGKPLG